MIQAEVNIPGPLMNVSVGGFIDSENPNSGKTRFDVDTLVAEKLQELSTTQTKQVMSALNGLANAAKEVREFKSQIIADSENDLVALALEISKTVLTKAIDAGQYEIDSIVKQALEALPSSRDVVVYLHPDDLAQCDIAKAKDDTHSEYSFEFLPDIRLSLAECRIETPEVTIDASVVSKLDQIRQKLTAAQESK